MGIKNLGFSPVPQKLFEESLEAPFGIILVTGPTGSGKSTTLYSIINQLNNAEKNIVTIEDPVEYQIEGITQIQVKPEIGLNFSSSLRSVLPSAVAIELFHNAFPGYYYGRRDKGRGNCGYRHQGFADRRIYLFDAAYQ